jgi:hypothetical protein
VGYKHEMSCIRVSNTSSTVRKDYTTHSLCIHSEGKKRLKKLAGGHKLGTGSIPV